MKQIPCSILWAAVLIVALGLTSCQTENPVTAPLSQNDQTSLAKEHGRAPSVPPILEVPAGNKVRFHAFAQGVQIYECRLTASGYAWVFVAPEATLYEAEDKKEKEELEPVGRHYAGPTWESNNGSKVVGTVLQRSNSPDPNAIPWLLLQAVSTSGHGIFAHVTYIQRLNTTGGKAPTTGADADHLGKQARIPYTADYYFYRAKH